MLKKIATPLILAVFLMVALFGFVAMTYGPDGKMEGGCPFSAPGMSLCPQDALAVVMHHISAYQSFVNVPMDSAGMILMNALLLAACVLILIVRPFLFRLPPQRNHFSPGPPVSARTRKITRWLSLLENSPS